MSDLPIIPVTSLTLDDDGTGFANAETVPDNLPQWRVCRSLHRMDCGVRYLPGEIHVCLNGGDRYASNDGPCPFDAVLRHEWTYAESGHAPDCDCDTGNTTCPIPVPALAREDHTFTVERLHHADECAVDHEYDDHDITDWCHPDALPGQWHLTFKGADREQ